MSSLNFSELLKKIFIPKHVTTSSCIKVPKQVVRTTWTWLDTQTPRHDQYSLFLSILKKEFCFLLALRSTVLCEMFVLPTFEALNSWVAWLTSSASTSTTSTFSSVMPILLTDLVFTFFISIFASIITTLSVLSIRNSLLLNGFLSLKCLIKRLFILLPSSLLMRLKWPEKLFTENWQVLGLLDRTNNILKVVG